MSKEIGMMIGKLIQCFHMPIQNLMILPSLLLAYRMRHRLQALASEF